MAATIIIIYFFGDLICRFIFLLNINGVRWEGPLTKQFSFLLIVKRKKGIINPPD